MPEDQDRYRDATVDPEGTGVDDSAALPKRWSQMTNEELRAEDEKLRAGTEGITHQQPEPPDDVKFMHPSWQGQSTEALADEAEAKHFAPTDSTDRLASEALKDIDLAERVLTNVPLQDAHVAEAQARAALAIARLLAVGYLDD